MSPSVIHLMLPEIVLTIAALGIMLWDLWLPAGKKSPLGWAAMAVCAALFALTFLPEVAKALRKQSTKIAEQLVGGLSERAKTAYGLSVDVRFPNERD